MTRLHRARLVALFTASCFSVGGLAAEQRWVHGSWVNLRAEPSANAKVVTQLTTNTPLELHAKRGDWCEVSATPASVRGYMTCRLIGEKPLTLADLGQPRRPDGDVNPDYIASRAFWIAPSVGLLLGAGDYFWRTMLTESQRASEEINTSRDGDREQVKPRRFPIPEFDAMKERMRAGVIAPAELRPPLVPWPALKAAKRKSEYETLTISGRWIDSRVHQLATLGRLDPVKPSLFRRITDIAPASASVEQLSAQFGIIERAQVLSGPEWVHHRHEEPRVIGHWDIGSLRLSLEKPVIEYVVGRRGLAAASQWKAEETQDYKADSSCNDSFSLVQRAKDRLPGYPQVKDPLVWFFTPAALPYRKVNIKTLARRIEPGSGDKEFQRAGVSLLVMHEIDLDGDGIPDISAWEAMGQPAGYGGQPESNTAIVRVIFANIAGEWHLLDADTLEECT